jgi:membrane-associated phospholipid phosphatase
VRHEGLGADLKAYFGAPLRWDGKHWLEFGGGLAAVAAAYQYDGRVRDHFVPASGGIDPSQDRHDANDAIPAAVALGGTWMYAALIHSADGRREARAMLEAAAFSSTASLLLKEAAGRERPDETADPNVWHEGGDSFPSTHVAAAFAIGTVLAESGNDDFRWVRRVLGYGLAVGTAYLRLDHNVHWLSDTVAGAGIGFGTAHFVMNRRYEDRAALSLTPFEGGGVMLSYAVDLRR